MKNRSLRRKILIYSSTVLVALIVAMVIYVNFQAARFVDERVRENLRQGIQRITKAETDRLAGLQLTAQLVASFPDLKALLATDLATIRDYLLDYQQRNRRFELLVVLDPSGRTIARTDALGPLPVKDSVDRWVQPVLAGQSATGILSTESGMYLAAAAPAVAGGTIFGFVLAGTGIDAALARNWLESDDSQIVILDDRILGSTLMADKLPWKSKHEWASKTGGSSEYRIVTIDHESYAAAATQLGQEGGVRPLVVVFQSRTRAMAPYRRIQLGLLVLGVLAAGAGISASAVLARKVTAPVVKLVEGTRQVAAGNFDCRMDIATGDEIGDLAESFNLMLRGLRERANMAKFVSQSTVEMIQSSAQEQHLVSQRVVRTIFISDLRGFTALSERLDPEKVVAILNRVLGLQAENIKKFQGDIDKYAGDSVVALFQGEDMVLNAIRCAVEIHKSLDAYNREQPEEPPLHAGIGIATGDVVLGPVGGSDRMDYTAIGSNVNLCSRLCGAAGPCEILLSEAAYQRVSGLVAAQPMEPLKVKGFTEPVSMYKMVIGRKQPELPMRMRGS
jgi:class 3 adenylate cyclase